MLDQDTLVKTLNEWLEPHKIKDHTFNGLQFEGKKEIKKIACAVDISEEVLQIAIEKKVDFLITHHGLIWGGLKKIDSFDKKRLKILFDHEINLYCSHLPLDIHQELGNNALLIKILGMKNTDELFFDVGYIAEYNEEISYNQFKSKVSNLISPKIVEMNFGPSTIKRVALCSGGAGLDLRALFEAHEKNAHTLLSGETNSLLYHYAKELSINVICAGHYATETFGVRAIISKLQTFYPSLEYEFLDCPTGF
ncbi:MAG: Nif3-like dinuclear metal center hexameric protein [Brevinema sp.]